MNARSQAFFWLAALAAALLLVWLLGPVLFPFVLGAGLAWLLDPAATWLERRGTPRLPAAMLAMAGFLGAGLAAFLLVVPPVGLQTAELFQQLPLFLSGLVKFIGPLLVQAGISHAAELEQGMLGGIETMSLVVWGLIDGFNLLGNGASVFQAAALLTITPVTAFYLLLQWPDVVAAIDDGLPRDHAEAVRGIAREIDGVLKEFLRGSFLLGAALAAFYGAALSLTGLAYGLAIGLLVGVLSFIPYVGTLFGLVLSLGIAFIQYWPEWLQVAVVVPGIFAAGQLLANYVLIPRIIDPRLVLHPLWLIFGLAAGGALFGLVGILFSVPAIATLGVLARFLVQRYKGSSLYRGSGGA